jgi:hypothetical protein
VADPSVMTSHIIGTVSAAEEESYSRRLEEEAKKRENGIYPRTIFVALGGTGAKALLHLRRLVIERFGALDHLEGVAFLSIDTDIHSQEPSPETEKQSPLDAAISFARDERVNVKIDFKNYVGPNLIYHPEIREWWDEAALPSKEFNLEMGAGQIRQLARLAFFANRDDIQEAIGRAYRKVTSIGISGQRVDTTSKVRVVVVAGLAGGTGSGMLLDLGAQVQDQLGHRETPNLEAFLVLPGGFNTVEQGKNYPKVAANGYAALKELNHYLVHPFIGRWEPQASPIEVLGLYERYVLFSGANAAGQQLADLGDCYRALGEILFLEFGAGQMAGWIQGVRVNRQQYLNSAITNSYALEKPGGGTLETHAERWKTAFSSSGLSKLAFPSWRLINRAKYELAAQMVALMDPGRIGRQADILNTHRDRFLFDAGFLEGDRQGDQGRERHKQVRDRLAKQVNAGPEIADVYQNLRRCQDELVALSASMYTEKNSVETGTKVWRDLANLWGDPYSPANEGDWPKQIRENRRALAREVHDKLPAVIEEYRRKPAVGLSGVMALLKEILELLERSADQAHYADWFRQQRPGLKRTMDESQKLWDKRLHNAHRTSIGFGSTTDNHQAAVRQAAEALGEHWRARINDYIADQAPEALKAIRASLVEQLNRLERLADKLHGLEAEYLSFARFYDSPQHSFIVHEIEPPANLGDLLEPYLGRQTDERSLRLQRLLDKGLRQMNLDTLEQIGDKLAGEYEKFRDNLATQAFYALRGKDGLTADFVENAADAVPGFIERYSIFKVLKDNFTADQRKDLFVKLYQKGLPWAQQNKAGAISTEFRPHGDAFLGCVTEGGYEDVAREMLAVIQGQANAVFFPRQVRAHDVSEIIFYSELTAFPAYYLSELTDLKRYYDSLLNDTRVVTPLHIDQDYHQFQPLMPFNQGQLASYKHAWQVFIQAQMLGLVRSLRLRADDDVRLTYQWRRKVGAFDVQWTDLGAEGRAIERLMLSPDLRGRLQADVLAEKERFLALPASLYPLIALADYYSYCIFPVKSAPEARVGLIIPLGSMQNLVADELRQEWRLEQHRWEADDRKIEDAVKHLLITLSTWSKPIYRDPRQLVPSTPEVPTAEQQLEWQLAEAAAGAIRTFASQGLVPQTRDRLGNLMLRFPRLAIDWPYFERGDEPARAPGDSTWTYRVDGGPEQRLTAAEIADRVMQLPASSHRVWTKGMDSWKEAREVPEIARSLTSASAGRASGPAREEAPPPPPSLESPAAAQHEARLTEPPPVPPPAGAERPPSAEPPPLAAPAGALFHYACDAEVVGKLSTADIARRVATSPDRSHRVWTRAFGTVWKSPLDVPEIAAELEEVPPPLV